MRTRKRCYDLEEGSTRKRTRKRCYDLNPACSSKMKGLSRTFMSLLAKACNGTDKSMGLPCDEEFWTKFAEKLRSQSNLQEKDLTAKSCEAYGKRLQHFYYALQDPGVVPQENMKSFSDLTQSPDLQNYNPLLENIFGRHPELFSRETSKTKTKTVVVLETPRSSNSSLKRANTNVVSSKVTSQSSGSSLRPELEMGLQEAFDDLVCHNMLDLRDVADAESYLSTSTWASSIFLQQEDLEKRSAMIINARKNAEEKKKRRKMGACRKY